MAKTFPVTFEPEAFKDLTDVAGSDLSEIELAIQMLLSRRPRQGPAFDTNLRAIVISPPNRRIIVIYDFDGESVFITKIINSPAPQSAQSSS